MEVFFIYFFLGGGGFLKPETQWRKKQEKGKDEGGVSGGKRNAAVCN